MFIVVGLISVLLIGGTMRCAVVPGRWQSPKLTYEFVANTVRSSTGNEGMKFFPFVFTLFMFVLFANLIGPRSRGRQIGADRTERGQRQPDDAREEYWDEVEAVRRPSTLTTIAEFWFSG